MAYIISEEGQELLGAVKEFCEKEIKEQCKEYDKTSEWSKEIYDKTIEVQLHMFEVPEEYDGMGPDCVSVAVLIEQMAIADSGFATMISASGLGMKPVLIGGTEEQKQHAYDLTVDGDFAASYLTEPGAGSDASVGKTTAVRDGDSYILNGRKCLITNGAVSSFYCVTVMTDKSVGTREISMFYVEKYTSGLSTGHEEDKMGIRTSNTCDVVLEDCRTPVSNLIGAEGQGFSIVIKTLDQARAWMGCIATDIAQRGMGEVIAYGKERIRLSKPALKNQALQLKIVDTAIKIETVRQMAVHALIPMDLGLPYSKKSAIVKCYVSDIMMEVASETIQMFGEYGYSHEYPVEKLLCDAKIFQIFEGTNEIQCIVVANNTIGRF